PGPIVRQPDEPEVLSNKSSQPNDRGDIAVVDETEFSVRDSFLNDATNYEPRDSTSSVPDTSFINSESFDDLINTAAAVMIDAQNSKRNKLPNKPEVERNRKVRDVQSQRPQSSTTREKQIADRVQSNVQILNENHKSKHVTTDDIPSKEAPNNNNI